MGAIDFELMSPYELWSLHEKPADVLAKRLTSSGSESASQEATSNADRAADQAQRF
jgi:hypothetical protein